MVSIAYGRPQAPCWYHCIEPSPIVDGDRTIERRLQCRSPPGSCCLSSKQLVLHLVVDNTWRPRQGSRRWALSREVGMDRGLRYKWLLPKMVGYEVSLLGPRLWDTQINWSNLKAATYSQRSGSESIGFPFWRPCFTVGMSPLVNNVETLGMSHSLTLMRVSVSSTIGVYFI